MLLFLLLNLLNPVLAATSWQDFQGTVAIEVHKTQFETVCTGVLLAPRVVLTAAHCLVDLQKARISNGAVLSSRSSFVEASHWKQHPLYVGNIVGKSYDVGVIFLKSEIFSPTYSLSAINPALPFKRIGFGVRSGKNRRTLITSSYEDQIGFYVRARDTQGLPGDSGGPVFQYQEDELTLVGIHTGRQMVDDNPLDISYIQPLRLFQVQNWLMQVLIE